MLKMLEFDPLITPRSKLSSQGRSAPMVTDSTTAIAMESRPPHDLVSAVFSAPMLNACRALLSSEVIAVPRLPAEPPGFPAQILRSPPRTSGEAEFAKTTRGVIDHHAHISCRAGPEPCDSSSGARWSAAFLTADHFANSAEWLPLADVGGLVGLRLLPID
jgi:hypothetical protein